MSDKTGFYIGNGIGLAGLMIAAAWLDINNKDAFWLWLGAFIWIVFGFWDGFGSGSKSNSENNPCTGDAQKTNPESCGTNS